MLEDRHVAGSHSPRQAEIHYESQFSFATFMTIHFLSGVLWRRLEVPLSRLFMCDRFDSRLLPRSLSVWHVVNQQEVLLDSVKAEHLTVYGEGMSAALPGNL